MPPVYFYFRDMKQKYSCSHLYLKPPTNLKRQRHNIASGRDRTTSDERARAHGICSSSASCDELTVSAPFQLD